MSFSIRVVAFDLDDTLAPEAMYARSGLRHSAKEIARLVGRPPAEIYRYLLQAQRRSPRRVFDRTLSALGVSPSPRVIKTLVESYRSHEPSIRFYPDVIPTLRELRRLGVRTAIITDGPRNSQRNKIGALNAEIHFDLVTLTAELGREFWKPHPRAFEVTRSRFGVHYEEMAYVGDNPTKDFYIRKAIPIHTVRILRPGGIYQDEDYLENFKEVSTIQSLRELTSVLNFSHSVFPKPLP